MSLEGIPERLRTDYSNQHPAAKQIYELFKISTQYLAT